MRWIASAALAALAIGAQAQTYFNGDRNILVPNSSIPQVGRVHTHYLIYVGPSSSLPNGGVFKGPNLAFAGPAGFHPADIQAAYKMPANGGTNAIAIVDAFDEGTPLSDFNTFSQTFGLPTESSANPTASSNQHLQVVYAQGSKPTYDAGWAGEEALDIEWAHAMAPNAKIYLVESADNSFANMFAAEVVAANLAGVKEVSNSWSGGESAGELGQDGTFVKNGVTFFASSGDTGGAQGYPAESPNVVGVGGTSLVMNGNNVVSETVWGGSGGGPSSFEPRPAYQASVQGVVGSARGCPDIAALADPNTGGAWYVNGQWGVVGGTSLACPICAGITNTRAHFANSSVAELTRVYQNQHNVQLYRDITSGSSGPYQARPGYDLCTGVGCPIGLYANIINPVNANAVSVLTGTYQAGTLSSLFTVDNDTYNVGSTSVVNVGQATTVLVSFRLSQPAAGIANLAISLNEYAPTGSTIQIFAYNWNTRNYDIVQAFPGLPAGPTDIANMANLGPYENGANTVQFAVRTFIPTRFGSQAFRSMLDQMVVQPTLSGQ
ncbi:MAG TPA: S53 family peptidase [Fimbriimonadaceae bacterium]|nr:S53 family peptidase [Fimbriimonadaceae bacterium]